MTGKPPKRTKVVSSSFIPTTTTAPHHDHLVVHLPVFKLMHGTQDLFIENKKIS